MTCHRTWAIFALTTTLAFLPNAAGQTVRGSLLGRVTNAGGQPVRGAAIQAVESDTSQKRTTQSGEDGAFVLAQLAAGTYRVEVTATGYHRVTQAVVLHVDQEVHLEVALTVSTQAADQVEVREVTPLLATESAALGTVFTNREITLLPLDGRNFYELALLLPGVVGAAPGSAGSARGDFTFNSSGSREDSNSYLLDGVFNGDPKLNGFAIAPPIDGVREFELGTSNYDASFGRNAGGQVNIVMKSGSNQLHGTVFEFLRNAALDGTNYFAPKDASPKDIRNQFGGSLGGALRKDRTFYFVDYEGRRLREGITQTALVPTALERIGDFSRSRLVPIDLYTGQPFPGFVIPIARMSPTALAIANLYPLPNRAVAGQNYGASPVANSREDRFDLRLDHQLSARTQLASRYSFGDSDSYEPFGTGSSAASVPGFGNNIPRRAQNFMLAATSAVSASLVNDMRLGFNRVSLAVNQQNQSQNLNKAVGIPVLSSNARDNGLTSIAIAGFSNLGDELNNPQRQAASSYQWTDNATWSRGRHLVKFGTDLREQRTNAFADVLSRGLIAFTGFTGNALAELLQDVPSYTTGARLDNPQHLRAFGTAFYLQDSVRLLPNLTLTAGLRYEFNTPPADPQNRASLYSAAAHGVVAVGQGSIPAAGYAADRNNFGPRLGMAWTPGAERLWTVRAGYGPYYDQAPLAPAQGLFFSPPYYNSRIYIQSAQAPVYLENPFPSNYPLFIPNSAFSFQPDLCTPYIQQWNASVQRQLGVALVAEVSYAGTKGMKLIANRDLNQAKPSVAQPNLRPNPLFSDIDIYESRANSSYHAMQAKLTQRLRAGLSALASYTWSKSIDDASSFFSSTGDPNFPQNSNNLRAERGRSNFDVRHRFSLSYAYDFPKSRTWILSGWKTAGAWTFQTGAPFTVTLLPGVDNSNTGLPSIGFGVVDRPKVAGDAGGSGSVTHWFNTGAFVMPQYGTFGNAGRNILSGPGLATINVSAIKETQLSESVKLALRVEVFNLLDRANFGLPDAHLGSPSFGYLQTAGDPRRVQLGLKLLF